MIVTIISDQLKPHGRAKKASRFESSRANREVSSVVESDQEVYSVSEFDSEVYSVVKYNREV